MIDESEVLTPADEEPPREEAVLCPVRSAEPETSAKPSDGSVRERR